MTVGEAVKASYLLGCSDKINGVLREDVLKGYQARDELQWSPIVESLVINPVVIPEKLDHFLRALFCNVNSTKVDRLVNLLVSHNDKRTLETSKAHHPWHEPPSPIPYWGIGKVNEQTGTL